MNCYDLTREFIQVIDDIQRLVEKKSKTSKKEHQWIDQEIDRLEIRMFEIKNMLKSIEV